MQYSNLRPSNYKSLSGVLTSQPVGAQNLLISFQLIHTELRYTRSRAIRSRIQLPDVEGIITLEVLGT